MYDYGLRPYLSHTPQVFLASNVGGQTALNMAPIGIPGGFAYTTHSVARRGLRNCCHRAGAVRGWQCPSNGRAPAVYV